MRKPKGSWIFQRELKCYIGKIRVKLKPPVDSFVLKYVISEADKLSNQSAFIYVFIIQPNVVKFLNNVEQSKH